MDKDEIRLNEDYEKMTAKEGWEKKLVEDLAMASIKEKRAARRWGVFFKLAFLTYIVGMVALYYLPFDPTSLDKGADKHTAVINVEGIISSESKASADYIITALRDAFKDKKTKGEYQITDALEAMIERGLRLKPFMINGWFDAGTQESLLAIDLKDH